MKSERYNRDGYVIYGLSERDRLIQRNLIQKFDNMNKSLRSELHESGKYMLLLDLEKFFPKVTKLSSEDNIKIQRELVRRMISCYFSDKKYARLEVSKDILKSDKLKIDLDEYRVSSYPRLLKILEYMI